MSGGFFRGTSADQDTRFSNKQAKLMKSQKFPSELDHLVDITKVKMDVMKPWIAQRATELLGFEDEVLINFIYGLLDGKAVNGKEIQISLTGFMEKNTGKFMKELWQLLLSAQNNVSGVPQQLLDAKEEETKKKQAESDKIKGELEKKKDTEAKEFEEERIKKLDMRTGTAALEPSSKHHPDREIFGRNGSRRRNRASRSPQSPGGLSLSPRNRRSSSMSKSFSNSRSYSEERRKSRGLSRSPTSRGRSKRSVTPHRKHSPPLSLSPLIRRSSHSRRRSTSRSRSPIRRRYMSRSPVGRRSQTPVRRRPRSPPRYRSKSPVRRRYPSPLRRRSPSPFRRGYRRSPSTPPRRSPSPVRRRSPIRNRRRSPTPPRHRSRSQESLGSPLPARRLSNSPVKKRSPKRQRSPLRSSRERTRAFKKSSPVLHARPRGSSEDSDESSEKPGSAVQRPSVSLRSPQRDTRDVSSSSSPQKSGDQLKVPADSRRRSPSKDRRSRSPYKSHSTQSKEHKVRDIRARDQKPRHDSPDLISKRRESDRVRNNGNQKLKPSERPDTSSRPNTQQGIVKVDKKHDYSPERSVGHHSKETGNRVDEVELSKSERTSAKRLRPEDLDKEKVPAFHKETEKSTVKVDDKGGSGSLSSGSDDSLKRHKRTGHEYGKHRRSQKDEVTSDESSDSEIENRKVAKRRKKEEKRERKEERRRRREERHRKREERRAEKLKAKSNNETVPDQKKLEIELREKALESLRAKKGVRL